MYKRDCYPDGSYFWDKTVDSNSEELTFVLPGSNLTTGQWVQAEGGVTADCSNGSNSGPFDCDPTTSPATLSVHLARRNEFGASQEGFYKCCLPTNCSDPNTNVITVNIFSKCYVYRCYTYYVYRIFTNIILYC